MKKIIAMLLACLMIVGLFAGCAGNDETVDTTAAAGTEAAGTEAAGNETVTAEAGSVYYLNFKPEFDEALQALAADYTAETGIEVKVVTAASGTYSDTLTAEMMKDDAPTIYNIGNMSAVRVSE